MMNKMMLTCFFLHHKNAKIKHSTAFGNIMKATLTLVINQISSCVFTISKHKDSKLNVFLAILTRPLVDYIVKKPCLVLLSNYSYSGH